MIDGEPYWFLRAPSKHYIAMLRAQPEPSRGDEEKQSAALETFQKRRYRQCRYFPLAVKTISVSAPEWCLDQIKPWYVSNLAKDELFSTAADARAYGEFLALVILGVSPGGFGTEEYP